MTAQTIAVVPVDVTSPILAWFDDNARELPWRNQGATPWSILVSEVMSQQTPIDRLVPAWRRWMQRWPTPCDLAAATPADVIREWGSLGYPRRALRLQETARLITEHHQDKVPDSYDDLVALPGIGDYTASAVLAFAFDQPVIVLDTNVRRVQARVFSGTAFPATTSPTQAERRLASQIQPASEQPRWAVAVMEFGALVCRAKRPACATCVIATSCRWNQTGCPPGSPPGSPQPFAGTDRQVRGKVLNLLRTAGNGEVSTGIVHSLWADKPQLERCLESLAADGLIESTTDGYRLPAGATP